MFQCQNDFGEKIEFIRDKLTYAKELTDKDVTSAVKEDSIWNSLGNFHVTDNTVCDVMHDIFLGVAKYNMSKILLYFIHSKKVFTLEAFNYRKQMFDYGPILVGTVSQPLSSAQLRTGNIKMKTFLNIILLLIGDLITENDPVHNFLIIFVRIVDIILKDDFDDSILATLIDLIYYHKELYTKIFKENLKPKYHFMIHYPTIIKQLGPLKHFWSFRYESKHQTSKQYCHAITSRRNIPYTLAIKHSLHFFNTLFAESFFKMDAYKFNSVLETDLSTYYFYKDLNTDIRKVFKFKVLYTREPYSKKIVLPKIKILY